MKVNVELSHDIIAKKIWERLPENDRRLRQVEKDLERRLEMNTLLGEDELRLWSVYLPRLKELDKYKQLIEDSEVQVEADREQKVKGKLAVRNSRLFGGLATLAIGMMIFALISSTRARRNQVKAEKALEELTEAQEKQKKAETDAEISYANLQLANEAFEKVGEEGGSSLENAPLGTEELKKDEEISIWLSSLAERMEKEELQYDNKNPSNLTDVSGIYHRLAKAIKDKYPTAIAPNSNQARDTRSILKWYYEKGNATIIDNPLLKRNLIKAGSILFFGNSGKVIDTNDLPIEELTKIGSSARVVHMGLVTKVLRDENNQVIGYEMMHGRRPGVSAERTLYHSITPPRAGYPILGNWNQQWVAVADMNL